VDSVIKVEYNPSDELEWQDSTDFDGVQVPLRVLHHMRKADGATEWKGRGVEVGDKGWKVLTDWKAQVDKERP